MDDVRPAEASTSTLDSRRVAQEAFLPKVFRQGPHDSLHLATIRVKKLYLRRGSREIFVQGSYFSSSPLKYASNSGLFSVGSSHGVSCL